MQRLRPLRFRCRRRIGSRVGCVRVRGIVVLAWQPLCQHIGGALRVERLLGLGRGRFFCRLLCRGDPGSDALALGKVLLHLRRGRGRV